MDDQQLIQLADYASEAHVRIQQDFGDINPVIGVSRQMRQQGIPADAMTIDCLRSGKRILIILHDASPTLLNFQFCRRDQDPSNRYESINFSDLSTQTLYDWMSRYFSTLDS